MAPHNNYRKAFLFSIIFRPLAPTSSSLSTLSATSPQQQQQNFLQQQQQQQQQQQPQPVGAEQLELRWPPKSWNGSNNSATTPPSNNNPAEGIKDTSLNNEVLQTQPQSGTAAVRLANGRVGYRPPGSIAGSGLEISPSGNGGGGGGHHGPTAEKHQEYGPIIGERWKKKPPVKMSTQGNDKNLSYSIFS